jgi:hypothetical protein
MIFSFLWKIFIANQEALKVKRVYTTVRTISVHVEVFGFEIMSIRQFLPPIFCFKLQTRFRQILTEQRRRSAALSLSQAEPPTARGRAACAAGLTTLTGALATPGTRD